MIGLDVGIRLTLVVRAQTRRGSAELFFLAVDLLVLISFLPLERWIGPAMDGPLVLLRLARLLALLRFVRGVAHDLFTIMTRREQLEQFTLVTAGVMGLAFSSAVVLHQLEIPHDYDDVPSSEGEGFLERMWWSFRQLESADNLVHNLHGRELLSLMSLGLTVSGVFVISFVIGIGANVVDQGAGPSGGGRCGSVTTR